MNNAHVHLQEINNPTWNPVFPPLTRLLVFFTFYTPKSEHRHELLALIHPNVGQLSKGHHLSTHKPANKWNIIFDGSSKIFVFIMHACIKQPERQRARTPRWDISNLFVPLSWVHLLQQKQTRLLGDVYQQKCWQEVVTRAWNYRDVRNIIHFFFQEQPGPNLCFLFGSFHDGGCSFQTKPC